MSGGGPAATLLIAAIAAGCAPARQDLLVDLVAELPGATVTPETRVVDFGTAAALPHLISGFPEWTGESRALLADTAQTRLRLELAAPRDAVVSLLARTSGGGRTAMTVLLNGAALGDIEVGPRYAHARIAAPAALWHAGSNVLEFRIATASGEPPPAVLWDELTIERQPPFPDSVPEVRPGSVLQLQIPFGTRLDYYARARDGMQLEIDELVAAGTAAQLRIETYANGADDLERMSETMVRVTRHESGFVQALPQSRDGFVRVSLTALPQQLDAAAPGSVIVSGARLVAPAPVETAPPHAPEPTPTAAADRAPSTNGPPSIVVFLVDTLRADRLGTYGYPRGTTPRIDEFAAGAVVFDRAVAQSSWTKASVASVFTGLYPAAHGVVEHDSVLIDDADTLAEQLATIGYETAGIVTISTVASLFGFDQGFGRYEELLEEPMPRVHQPASRVVDAALRWIDARAHAQRPFFLYLHVADPHTPYMPPDDMRARFAPGVDAEDLGNFRLDLSDWEPTGAEVEALRDAASALYDAEIAYVDTQFGRLVDGLTTRGLMPDLTLLLLSDHGEEFYEHGGFTHGHTLYQEQLHVPMVLRLARGASAGDRIESTVRHIDVLPTLIEIAGAPIPASIQGTSMVPLLTSSGPQRQALSQLRLGDLEIDSLIDDQWKLIASRDPGSGMLRHELFNLSSDARELRDMEGIRPVARGFFAAWLARLVADLRIGALDIENAVLDPEVTERLRALGYIR